MVLTAWAAPRLAQSPASIMGAKPRVGDGYRDGSKEPLQTRNGGDNSEQTWAMTVFLDIWIRVVVRRRCFYKENIKKYIDTNYWQATFSLIKEKRKEEKTKRSKAKQKNFKRSNGTDFVTALNHHPGPRPMRGVALVMVELESVVRVEVALGKMP